MPLAFETNRRNQPLVSYCCLSHELHTNNLNTTICRVFYCNSNPDFRPSANRKFFSNTQQCQMYVDLLKGDKSFVLLLLEIASFLHIC